LPWRISTLRSWPWFARLSPERGKMALSDVIGHRRQLSLLRKILAGGGAGTAYLFAGPRGVGKMTAALEFARALLCSRGGEDACGRCESCRLTGGGAHPDLLTVTPEEKKKYIRIEQVRDAQGFLSLKAAAGKRKVVIFDPAERLTLSAVNAMLKTLEEPPPGGQIILVSSNVGALPPTVISRCRKVNFGFLGDEEVAEVLEKKGWIPEKAAAAASLAEGSPGSVLLLGDDAWKRAGKDLEGFVKAMREGDRNSLLGRIEGFSSNRAEGELLVSLLLGQVRRELRKKFYRGGGAAAGSRALEGMSGEQLHRLASRLMETSRLLAGNVNVKLALGDVFGRWDDESPPAAASRGGAAPSGDVGAMREQRNGPP
jgi:DNA polymerase-3 subunit delta'